LAVLRGGGWLMSMLVGWVTRGSLAWWVGGGGGM
jgi:hypothetical protein